MSFSNTVHDGSGTSHWLVCESAAPYHQLVTISRSEGHTPVQHDSGMGDGQIVAAAAVVYAIVASIDGGAAGDIVEIIDGGGAGTVRFTIVFSAADETIVIPLALGPAAFATDVWLAYATAGTIYVSVTYD